ncbi:hypothetical protein GOB86_08920 [Acetobacter lambici]|uniref:hypothetical protein n=1 Tax=Acetobacter lambici TaxID=1332824 RepID=UPI00140807A6|nr:hypothetical protein [Acetobacter lambici]NHO57181.1 hypothetical protein [Acetobacter lambici]
MLESVFKIGQKMFNFYVFYFVVMVLLCVEAFVAHVYAWDLDHEMYYGARLLHGELVWTSEFHDKLPFVPFLFIIPAYFKSIDVFQIISMGLIFSTSIFMKNIFEKLYQNYKISNSIYYFCTALYPFLLCFSYNSFATINCIGVSFYVLSFLLLIKENFLVDEKKVIQISTLLLGSMLAAMAISIRPYYLPSYGVILILSVLLSQENKTIKNYLWMFGKISMWVMAIAVWGFFLNAFPYVVTGQFASFLDGLAMLASPINPISGPESFFMFARKTPDLFFWGSWSLMGILVVSGLVVDKRNFSRLEIKIFSISFLSGVALLFFIISQHYWEHYIQLFMGNFCICVMAFLVWQSECKLPAMLYARYGDIVGKKILPISLVSLLIIPPVDMIKRDIKNKNKDYYDIKVAQATRKDWKAEFFAEYVNKNYRSKRPDFLFPEDIKAHWILDEPRHHFLHAANTRHVFFGWWEKLKFRSSHFYVVSNGEQYCQLIKENGPTLIAVTPSEYLTPCLSEASSGYVQDAELKQGKKVLLVFKRAGSP